ncbi:unnamed protein product, partial [Allacma fusca]
LDLLGFLTTAEKSVRGNMALKDQNMTLKWVLEGGTSAG